MAERIAEKIRVMSVSKPSERALRRKNSLAGDYVAMRTAYGKLHHWPLDATGVDIDAYDHDPSTFYFLALESSLLTKRHLNAGLRLTQISNFDDSLSLSMWGHAVDKQRVTKELVRHKQDVVMLKNAAKNGNLWDLTRLVTAMSVETERTARTKRVTYVALLLMLGAAMKHTGPDAVWIFTTNRETKRFLDRLGIQYALLAQGRIGYSDAGESYFGWTSAPAAYDQIKNVPSIIADLIERGYMRGATPHSGADSVS